MTPGQVMDHMTPGQVMDRVHVTGAGGISALHRLHVGQWEK